MRSEMKEYAQKNESLSSPFLQNNSLYSSAVEGFSKLLKTEKIEYLVEKFFAGEQAIEDLLRGFWHQDHKVQKVIDEFSENTLSNFYFPFGVVPNFILNNKNYCVPMVIEESSVVAACSRSAKFWSTRGGFKAQVIESLKVGQVHFYWHGEAKKLQDFFKQNKNSLMQHVAPLTENMQKRGGGLVDLELRDKSDLDPGYFQLFGRFETCDAMGANFINTVLESLADEWKDLVAASEVFAQEEKEVCIIMSILSNYTPECLVRVWVECPVADLNDPTLGMDAELFAQKLIRAVKIAKMDTYRATTHNKGIFNGIDAVVLATGNDFRAVEACGHTYAAREGSYAGLSDASVQDGIFKFWLEIPIAVGTVGGLTSLHPMAKFSLDLLRRPCANELMQIIASVGLAQNFGALRSLVTTGIQKGHMKMHLMNILNHLGANEVEREKAKVYFAGKTISFKSVRDYLAKIRMYQ